MRVVWSTWGPCSFSTHCHCQQYQDFFLSVSWEQDDVRTQCSRDLGRVHYWSQGVPNAPSLFKYRKKNAHLQTSKSQITRNTCPLNQENPGSLNNTSIFVAFSWIYPLSFFWRMVLWARRWFCSFSSSFLASLLSSFLSLWELKDW